MGRAKKGPVDVANVSSLAAEMLAVPSLMMLVAQLQGVYSARSEPRSQRRLHAIQHMREARLECPDARDGRRLSLRLLELAAWDRHTQHYVGCFVMWSFFCFFFQL